MTIASWIVIAGLALPLYAYLGYPFLLFVLASFVQTARDAYYLLYRRDRRSNLEDWPRVSVIIAAYNEERAIGRTIAHCLALDYPPDQLEVILGSDGSTDGTVEIAQRYKGERVRVLPFRERRGKLAVVRDCVDQATGDLLVFTDANTSLEFMSVRNLARHFRNPRVGAVCGELRLVTPEGKPANEGCYWRYEMILKILESRLDSVLGANGAIYAVRASLLPSIPDNTITEDFVIPMKVRAGRARVAYDPEAVAYEEVPANVADEFRRRVRIGAGNWQALRECSALLLPWKGFVAFAFWSHKVLRWFTPFLLPVAFLANLFLLDQPFWRAVFLIQVAFYACALVGNVLQAIRLPAGPLRLAGYFVAINAALGVGFLKGVFGLQRAAWARTARRNPTVGREA